MATSLRGLARALPVGAILAMAGTAPCLAQSAADELELMRSVLQTERKVIVARNMQLSDAESEGFWPLYNEYEARMRSVGDRRVKLLTRLAREFDTLTDEVARELVGQALEFQEERVEARKEYMKKFRKVLSDKRVARFFQIESKLDAMIDFDVARAVPLVR